MNANQLRTTCRSARLASAALIAGLAMVSGNAISAPAAIDHDQLATDRIIVKFNDSVAAHATTVFDRADVSSRNRSALARALSRQTGLALRFRRTLSTGADLYALDSRLPAARLAALTAVLSRDPAVAYAEPDRLLQPMLAPNDSRYNEQWHYFETTGGLNLPTAWDSATGTGVVTAVIDTGYRGHADLAANLLPGYDMISDTFVSRDGNGRDSDATDPGDYTSPNDCYAGWPGSSSSWHGTHVAGTIAAVTNNGSGVAGVAFGAKVVPVRVLGRCGGYTSDIADGIVWASGGSVSGVPANANPAKVLNLSLGGTGSCSSTTQSAINTARANGASVVVAAGNSNTNASNANPANCAGVITVAATDRSGGRAYYSNYGNVVDVAAPGGETNATSSNGVLSTLNTGSTTPGSDTYSFYQGTSMATPHVAGLAALLYQVDPSITPDQVESTITSTARSFPAGCGQCGSGIADAAAAVAAAAGGPGPGPGELANGVPETGLSASTGAELRYTLDVPAGASNLSFAISGGTGDADLYVRFGSEPTTGSFDCRPYLNGNNETCNIAAAQTGTYYVMVRAYSSFSGVSLVGSYDEDSGPPGGGGGSASADDVSGSRRQFVHFTVDIPAGMSTLIVTTSGGSGDADLYVRYGSQPSRRQYDCRSQANNNSESCTLLSPQAGTWYVSLYGYSAFSGVDLLVQWSP